MLDSRGSGEFIYKDGIVIAWKTHSQCSRQSDSETDNEESPCNQNLQTKAFKVGCPVTTEMARARRKEIVRLALWINGYVIRKQKRSGICLIKKNSCASFRMRRQIARWKRGKARRSPFLNATSAKFAGTTSSSVDPV